jgi:excisionase family DNA binding protein
MLFTAIMNKKDAAAYLGISTRALERHVSLNHIGVTYHRGKTGDEAVFDENELEHFKLRLDQKKTPRPAISYDSGESITGNSAIVRASDTGLSVLAAIMEAARSTPALPSVSIGEKIMLTLADASALTSLSVSHLREALRSGRLKGKIIGRGYRVKRDDLDAYIKRL